MEIVETPCDAGKADHKVPLRGIFNSGHPTVLASEMSPDLSRSPEMASQCGTKSRG